MFDLVFSAASEKLMPANPGIDRHAMKTKRLGILLLDMRRSLDCGKTSVRVDLTPNDLYDKICCTESVSLIGTGKESLSFRARYGDF